MKRKIINIDNNKLFILLIRCVRKSKYYMIRLKGFYPLGNIVIISD